MRQINFTVPSHSVVDLSEFASAFAELNSDDQAIVLQEMFDALKFKCKDDHKYNSQLCFIAVSIQRYNFKELVKSIGDLNYFIEKEDL